MKKSISLSYKDGGSDKVYNASIEEGETGFLVNFSYGKRGNALTTGSKTQEPVDSEKAIKIFDKLVKEKMAKGYKQDGSDITVNHIEKVDTGMHGQLLNPIEEECALSLLHDDRYMAQEKHDGRRMLLELKNKVLRAANRKGQEIPVPDYLTSIASHPNDFIIDGENMGSYFQVFDILDYAGFHTKGQPAIERAVLIHEFKDHKNVRITETATHSEAKERLFRELTDAKAEGIVFKLKSAPYVPGRPNSKGPQLKFKFYATASFIVLKVNTQRSVRLGLYQSEMKDIMLAVKEAGNVTIPVNHEVPNEGDIIEVKYLYAFKESGSVYQPSYLGKRDDTDPIECTTNQLKFKPENEE